MDALPPNKKPVIRVYSREEFLSLARLKHSETGTLDVTAEERFYDAVYSGVFEDTRHLLLRLDGLYSTDAPLPDIKQADSRLNFKLAAFSHDPNRSMAHVEARFHSAYWQDVATAAYILGSMDEQDSLYLDRVLDLFFSSEPAFRPGFVTGLKHGKHPEITRRLESIVHGDARGLKSEIHEILSFRKTWETENTNLQ